MVATAPPAKCIVYQAKKKMRMVETSFFTNSHGHFLTRLMRGPPPRNSRMHTQNPARGAGKIFELIKLKEFIDNIVDWSRTMDSWIGEEEEVEDADDIAESRVFSPEFLDSTDNVFVERAADIALADEEEVWGER
jgi:hypothetical protein